MKKNTLFSLLLAAGMVALPSLVNAQAKVTLTTAKAAGSEFSFVTNPGKITVDWGDGNVEELSATGEPVKGNLKGQTVTITSDNLWLLDCSSNELTNLSVVDATNLQTLYCSNNSLKALSVGSRSLKDLDCSGNELASLSLLLYKDLRSLNCSDNNIVSLSLNYQTELETLICSDNKLSSLIVSKSPNLKVLWCQNNSLKSLDLSSNAALESLVCDNNEISSLNIQNCTGIVDFWCDNNQLESINLQNNLKLETFSCSNNVVSSLNVPAIKRPDKALAFYCDGNKLTFSAMHSWDNILNEANAAFGPQVFPLSESEIKVGKTITVGGMSLNLDGDAVYPKYEWKNGEIVLEKGSKGDYTARSNIFSFNKPFESIVCEVTSTEYPGVILTSSPLKVFSTETSIQDIMDAYGFSYITNNGVITMKSEQPYRVNIYTTDGKQVWSGWVSGEERVNLGHGIFLVNGMKISL